MAATFDLGAVVATPGAIEFLDGRNVSPLELLKRHASGDWGDLGASDRKANDRALKTGERLLSAYDTPDAKVWVVTEWDRSSTCLLLPSEY